ncbi:MAG: DUF1573 domain-containing protein [Bacteroidia bacterium]
MKRLLFFSPLLILLAAFTVSAEPQITFKETKYNFGFLRQGEIVKHSFVFTNTGSSPLVISKAEVQCECTKVDFPKKPVMPNATDSIVVTFDSKSTIDRQERTVTVSSNALNNPAVITFKAVVLKPKNKK